MVATSYGLHRKKKLPKKPLADYVVYVAVFLGPIANAPQLIRLITTKTAEGVSVIAWLGLGIVSSIWLYYGIVHKDRPLILMNGALAILQFSIAVFAFLYQ